MAFLAICLFRGIKNSYSFGRWKTVFSGIDTVLLLLLYIYIPTFDEGEFAWTMLFVKYLMMKYRD
jgi:hypothetical protein